MAPPSGKNVSKEKDLYRKLVFNLARSPADSIQVVAFLMWLQNLIVTDLLIGEMVKHPIKVVDAFAGEIMECLKCVQSEIMPFTEGVYDVSLLRAFVFNATKLDITLDHLYRNRRVVIKGVKKMVRAFNAIYEEEDDSPTQATPGSKFFSDDAGNRGSNVIPPTPPPKAEAAVVNRYVPYGRYRRDEEDGRTIFLTFSNGYPIPAQEVASFFNKNFGRSVVDKIYMKNVEGKEQVLYARMVCTEPAAVDAIVGHHDGIIAKYVIRGRHVWARKYVKRYRSASA